MTILSACSSDELADGKYQIEAILEGGSGRAGITSPTDMVVTDGGAYARIEWSSPNYDYMIVDGNKYLPVNSDGNSVFEIPIEVFDEPIKVIADTTAMSTPHEIEYTITFSYDAKEKDTHSDVKEAVKTEIPQTIGESLTWNRKMQTKYATGFSVDYYEDADTGATYKLLTVTGDGQYLLVPDGGKVPEKIDSAITIIKSAKKIYLVASQAMDMFDSIDAVDNVKFCALKQKDWYIQGAKEHLASGDMVYAGKYSAPDYELIVNDGCNLAIENTMIYHTPEVKEKLESFNIPVIVDRSSYESEPLGRTEWVKFYAALMDKEKQAQDIFEKQVAEFESISNSDDNKDRPTVAFFYVSSNGTIKVRKAEDYLPKMIEMAGGEYVFNDLGKGDKNVSSTVTLQMEEFYLTAKDADYIIYNSTVDGELNSVDDLVAKNELFSNFKAVKEGKVYGTSANLYQSSMELGTIIKDMNKMLSDEDDMTYLYKLK